MKKFKVVQTRELIIEAPTSVIAYTIAKAGFEQKLSPAAIEYGMSISNIQNETINVKEITTGR